MFTKYLLLYLFFLCIPFVGYGQTSSVYEPVRYIGGEIANPTVHDGGLRYLIGTENIQVVRANRTNPDEADGFGFTYNHAPNLTYWNETFFLQYLSGAVNEHEPPVHTLLVTSKDGRNWNKPIQLFPPYEPPVGVEIPEGYTGYMMHQRMGFYTAPDGRLLTLAFYGHTEQPFREGGIGRVVREIYKDGTLGPIYFIRYSSHTGWNQSNTSYPFYKESADAGFVAACDALLNDKVKTLQWWDEDKGLDGFYTLKDTTNILEAFSYYHRKDGKLVGLWKKSYVTLSDDEGMTWSEKQIMPTLIMAGGKNWGQQTKDGRYAMVYNPIATQEYRYPLIGISSDDGILFDNMGVIHGEVPPRRFYGRWKDFGPNYTRGITEGEGVPPGNDMWVTYSVNKEDIWVSRVPLPLQVISTEKEIYDNFDAVETSGKLPGWNIYSPQWARVEVVDFPSAKNKSLRLKDEDPYDYAKTIRIFEAAKKKQISFKLYVEEVAEAPLHVEINDRYGNRPVRLILDTDNNVKVTNGYQTQIVAEYNQQQWYTFSINLSVENYGFYTLSMDGKVIAENISFAESVQ
ncbi:MAG: exo-alpha-sialidase, partial [Tannerellaceae bacterium]|nr:exo-alpha-sialidase [Tannerellaceae bacterium]